MSRQGVREEKNKAGEGGGRRRHLYSCKKKKKLLHQFINIELSLKLGNKQDYQMFFSFTFNLYYFYFIFNFFLEKNLHSPKLAALRFAESNLNNSNVCCCTIFYNYFFWPC